MCAHGQIFKLSQGFLVNLSTLVYQLKVGELAAALTDLEGAIRLIPEDEKSASAQFSVEVRAILDRLSSYGDRLELDPSLNLQIQQLRSGLPGTMIARRHGVTHV